MAFIIWSGVVVFGALSGWWIDPIVPPDDPRSFMDAAVKIIEAENQGNVAIVLLEDGVVFSEYFTTLNEQIDGNTLFPTASMSKWITACGVMALVEEGKLELDSPVASELTRWTMPQSEFDNSGVTVRRLLSHTAGLTDDLGFGDYEPEEELPSLVDALTQPRASSGEATEIKVGLEPGAQWRYSGGGYMILQLLIEETSGKTFSEFIHDTFFLPLGMTRSSYDYIGESENTSKSYHATGEQATVYKYAAASATGFSTTTNDLTRFLQAQIHDADSPKVLSDDTLDSMRTPHGFLYGIDIWGLGTMLYAPTAKGDFVFGHDGGNDPAINSMARINPDTGDAIIVLVTGHKNLASTLGFHWVVWQTGTPDFLNLESTLKGAFPILLGGYGIMIALGLLVYIRRRKLGKEIE